MLGAMQKVTRHAATNDSIETSPAQAAVYGGSIPAATATLDEICAFAHAVDGYELAGSFERCAAMHGRIRERFDAGLPLAAEMDELRSAVFFAHRAEQIGRAHV